MINKYSNDEWVTWRKWLLRLCIIVPLILLMFQGLIGLLAGTALMIPLSILVTYVFAPTHRDCIRRSAPLLLASFLTLSAGASLILLMEYCVHFSFWPYLERDWSWWPGPYRRL